MKTIFSKLLLPFCFLFFFTVFTSCEMLEENNQTHEHVFTNYVSDGNATYTEDGTKTATCNHEGCSVTNTITDVGSMLKNVLLIEKSKVVGVTEEGKTAKAIDIPSTYNGYSITSISDDAFSDCTSLESVSIPSSITNIDDGVFSSCKSIKNITVSENNKKYKSIDGNLYNKSASNTTLLQYARGKTETSFIVPDGVTVIDTDAFSYCVHLREISFPASVRLIQPAFFGCKNLLNISVSEANNEYTSIDGNLYNKNVSRLVKYAGGKTETSFTVPSSVTQIGICAFSDSTHLSNITLPNSLTKINEVAFSNCTSLTSIIFDGTKEQWKKTPKMPYWNLDSSINKIICTDGEILLYL